MDGNFYDSRGNKFSSFPLPPVPVSARLPASLKKIWPEKVKCKAKYNYSAFVISFKGEV